MMDHLFLFIILALIAEILGTMGGFGSSLFFVPMAGFFLDFYSVLGITALFHLSSNVSKIALFRHGFNKQLILRIGIPAVVFVIAGAYLSSFFDKRLLEIVLGVFLIGLSLVLLIATKLTIEPTLKNSLVGGALSGFTAGILGTGGAIRGLTMAAFSLPKDVFIATSAVIDLGIDFSRSVVYFSNGYMHWHDMYLIPVLILVSFAGTFLGQRILRLISDAQFKKLVLLLILGVGFITLGRQLWLLRV